MEKVNVIRIGERRWMAAEDLQPETILGCEAPWLVRKQDDDKSSDKSVDSSDSSDSRDWQLTREYLVQNRSWQRKHNYLEQQLKRDETDKLSPHIREQFQASFDAHKEKFVNPMKLFENFKMAKFTTQEVDLDPREHLVPLTTEFKVSEKFVQDIHRVIATNAFSDGMFHLSSYVNHSCNHNAVMLFQKLTVSRMTDKGQEDIVLDCPKCHFKEKNLHFFLIRPVKKGEEITFNYFQMHEDWGLLTKFTKEKNQFNVTLPLSEMIPNRRNRKKMIDERFGFNCLCSKCK